MLRKISLEEAERLVVIGELIRLRSTKKELAMEFTSEFLDLDVIEVKDGDVIRRYRPR